MVTTCGETDCHSHGAVDGQPVGAQHASGAWLAQAEDIQNPPLKVVGIGGKGEGGNRGPFSELKV